MTAVTLGACVVLESMDVHMANDPGGTQLIRCEMHYANENS